MNKVVKYMFIVFITILILVAIASYFNYRYDNAVGPNLITAFVGVAVSALVTLVLLKGQTKDEEEKDKNIQLFQFQNIPLNGGICHLEIELSAHFAY